MYQRFNRRFIILIWRIVAIYALVGCLWIAFSDLAIAKAVQNPDIMTRISMYKGFGFILFTATLLFFLVSKYANTVAESTRRLTESEEKLKFIFDSMNDAVGLLDPATGQHLDANRAACEMLGFTLEEKSKVSFDQICSDDSPFSKQNALSMLAKAEELSPRLFEWQVKRKDGRTFWAEISMHKGTIAGQPRIITVARDITERKRAEEETKNLTERLIESQKMESLGRLAAGIAHDFNNLLTPVIGFAELLKMDLTNNKEAQKSLDQIVTAASRARDLIQQLLSFGRKQLLNTKAIDLNATVSSFFQILRRTIREDIDIRLNLSADPTLILADKTQIEQILMNLAVNSQDAIPERGVIRIKTETVVLEEPFLDKKGLELEPGLYAMLSFEDTGSGMDNEVLTRLFEPFFTTKGLGRGTGLGLSTVYGIVRQHGGNLWVESKRGKGTVFRVYFPSIQENPTPEISPTNHKAFPIIPQTKMLLLVEDNKTVLDLEAEILRSAGYTLLTATDVNEALQIVAAQPPIDLLISDVIMPKLNGPELFKIIKRSLPQIKVLYLSGYAGETMEQKGIAPHAENFIQKPFAVQEFLSKIALILAQE